MSGYSNSSYSISGQDTATESPIIQEAGTVNGKPMGRIRPGTRIAVRLATEEEIVNQWRHIVEYGDGKAVAPYSHLVVFADDPSQVLHDWFSPRGGWYRDQAVEEAEIYAKARGAEVVDL